MYIVNQCPIYIITIKTVNDPYLTGVILSLDPLWFYQPGKTERGDINPALALIWITFVT